MPVKIGVVSQKGGVGKSTLCRLIAREYAAADWNVKIADMDIKQSTSFNWNARRMEHGILPDIAVEQFGRMSQALRIQDSYDLLVFDGAPHSTAMTLEIAKDVDLVILPTGTPVDDLEPTLRLAHELKQNGIPREKMAVALCRVGESDRELEDAREYIKLTGYYLLPVEIQERTAYKQASDEGKALSETPFKTLNDKAQLFAEQIETRIEQLTNKAKAYG